MKFHGNDGDVSSCWKLAFGLSFMFSLPHSQAATPSVHYMNLTLYWGKWAMSEVYYPALFEESPRLDKLIGMLVVPEGEPKDACSPETKFNVPPYSETWIAFIARGGCTFKDKINVAAGQGAAGVIIYDQLYQGGKKILVFTRQESGDIVALMMSTLRGKQIVRMIQGGIRVFVIIEMKTTQCFWKIHLCAYSLILTFIAYVLLGCTPRQVRPTCEAIRFGTTKSELRKAVHSLEVREITVGDKELDGDVCVVCIESYKPNEVLRILTCKHSFHKSCVDRWLVKHGVCPMCNASVIQRS